MLLWHFLPVTSLAVDQHPSELVVDNVNFLANYCRAHYFCTSELQKAMLLQRSAQPNSEAKYRDKQFLVRTKNGHRESKS